MFKLEKSLIEVKNLVTALEIKQKIYIPTKQTHAENTDWCISSKTCQNNGYEPVLWTRK